MRTFLRILYEEVNLFERLSWYNQLMVSIVYVGSNFPIVTHCMIFWAGSIAVILRSLEISPLNDLIPMLYLIKTKIDFTDVLLEAHGGYDERSAA